MRLGWLSAHHRVGRVVAVKCLHPQYAADTEFIRMFLDEARLSARLRHPNVASILDFVSEGDELYLVMEYIHGEALARLARDDAGAGLAVNDELVAAIAVGMLYGLHAAHEARAEDGTPLGLVHRDVSPQNVLVGVDGVARLLDFGVAKAMGRLQTTRDGGGLKGKLAYMAPEQLLEQRLDRRADVYAVAVVLWELLAGRRLFEAENQGALVGRVLAGAADPPSDYAPGLSPTWDEIVMRGLSREPARRFESAREMALAIEAAFRPAPAHRLGEWVQERAVVELERRARLIAELERASGLAEALPEVERAPAPMDDAQQVGATQSVSVALREARAEPPHRRRGAVLALPAAAALIAAFAMNRAPSTALREPSAGIASPGVPLEASTPRVVAASASAATTPVSATSAPVSATSAPASSLPVVAHRPALAVPNRASARAPAGSSSTSRRQGASGASPQAPGCESSFTIDERGVTRVRRECL